MATAPKPRATRRAACIARSRRSRIDYWAWTPNQNRWQAQPFAFLAPEKRQAIQDIQQDYPELINEVQKMAEHLAAFAPFVPRTMKAMVNFGMEASLAGALMFEKYAQGALVQTEDKVEGISAFLGKRKPNFKGR